MLKTDITVIIALENRTRALPAILTCLAKQTLPAACYEVIFVLYGHSTREQLAVVEHYAAGAPMPVKCLYAPASSEVHARNVGAFSARGEWLLFLDQDLLAGPRLLSSHLDLHRKHPVRAIVQGAVERSKSLPAGSLTRWFMRHDKDLLAADRPDSPLYWSSRHCSLPHDFFIEGGGFNESYEVSRAADIVFLKRILRNGSAALTLPGVHAFIWREAQFEEERRRFWREGFDLCRLSRALKDPDIMFHFELYRAPIRFWMDDAFMPFYIKICREGPLDVRIHGKSCLRVFTHECRRGAVNALTEQTAVGRPESVFIAP